jgi:tyrosyl-tRNA synthetase
MFGKVMSVSDALMWRYYELLTDLPVADVTRLKQEVEEGKRHPRDAKVELAKQIIRDFHSQAAANEAEAEFNRRFREHQAPSEIEMRTVQTGGAKTKIVDLLVQTGLVPSKAEARRLISQGGVKLNNERVGEAAAELDTGPTKEALLQVGKLKFLKITFE